VTGCVLVLVRRDAPAPGPPPRALVRGLATVPPPSCRQPPIVAGVALACASIVAHALCARRLARAFFARPPFDSGGVSGRCRRGAPCNLSRVVLVRSGQCARFSSRPLAAAGRRPGPVPLSTHPFSSTRALLVAAAAASAATAGFLECGLWRQRRPGGVWAGGSGAFSLGTLCGGGFRQGWPPAATAGGRRQVSGGRHPADSRCRVAFERRLPARFPSVPCAGGRNLCGRWLRAVLAAGSLCRWPSGAADTLQMGGRRCPL